mgnify:CR=1 FL=1
MLTPEDSKRVADKLIQTIDRLENRHVLVLNNVDKKVSETNLNNSIANGIETSLQRLQVAIFMEKPGFKKK